MIAFDDIDGGCDAIEKPLQVNLATFFKSRACEWNKYHTGTHSKLRVP